MNKTKNLKAQLKLRSNLKGNGIAMFMINRKLTVRTQKHSCYFNYLFVKKFPNFIKIDEADPQSKAKLYLV